MSERRFVFTMEVGVGFVGDDVLDATAEHTRHTMRDQLVQVLTDWASEMMLRPVDRVTVLAVTSAEGD